ncbi:MAG TPA: hypothetical protein VGD94_13045 [Vicinamibacterales bacterium]
MVIVIGVALLALQQTPPPKPPQLPSCDARPEASQFDFWVGEWDVIVNGKPAGINRIEKILGGCVLQENWTSAAGSEGKSWNWHDIGDGKWHQLWLDAQGAPSLNLAGEFSGNVMDYEGTSVGPGGARVMNRLQFFKLPGDRIRQFWQQSNDGGKTWTTVFDGEYRRRK